MGNKNLLISTTESIEGYHVVKSYDLLFSNVVIGTGLWSEFTASIIDIVGGRSKSYQKQMDALYDGAKEDLLEKAQRLGANAIVGFRICANEISGKGVSMFMLTAYGTAVSVVPVEIGRYDMYYKLLHLKEFLVHGIITQEEYDYECRQIQNSSNNAISSDLQIEKENEQRKREIDEFYRQVEEKTHRYQQQEEERQRQIIAERESNRNLMAGVSERLSKAIKEVVDSGNAEIKTRFHIPSGAGALPIPSNLTQLLDAVRLSTNDNMFDVICDYLINDQFYTACVYYIKSTGIDDFEAAQEYVIGVKNLYEGMSLEKRIEKITTRSIEAYKPEDTTLSHCILSRYISANDNVFDYLISVMKR